jgi:hypothetical protein
MPERYKLIKHMEAEYYTTPAGDLAAIAIFPDDRARLSIRLPNGKTVFSQEYKTRRGAILAMTRRFGKCRFESMMQAYKRDDSESKR